MEQGKKTTRKTRPAKDENKKKEPARKTSAAAVHDPERTVRRGMTAEAVAEDEAETMASTGDSEGTFSQIVTGTATGLGIDRGESIGT